jgi:hypothetical protein
LEPESGKTVYTRGGLPLKQRAPFIPVTAKPAVQSE